MRSPIIQFLASGSDSDDGVERAVAGVASFEASRVSTAVLLADSKQSTRTGMTDSRHVTCGPDQSLVTEVANRTNLKMVLATILVVKVRLGDKG